LSPTTRYSILCTTPSRSAAAAGLVLLAPVLDVLRGEMSLVGPRPLLMEYLPLYSPEQATMARERGV
jgi:lipopolysaccharide/colanic/teichoic acid biosynthesis glycosyltransferase